jgi:membrane-bound lytic murein transglycosylase B
MTRLMPAARAAVSVAAVTLALVPGLAAAQDMALSTAPPAFATCRADLITWATQRAVPQRLAEAQIAALTPDPDVLAATRSQGEFVRPIWDYIEASVTPARIAAGQRKLAEHADTLAAIEAA